MGGIYEIRADGEPSATLPGLIRVLLRLTVKVRVRFRVTFRVRIRVSIRFGIRVSRGIVNIFFGQEIIKLWWNSVHLYSRRYFQIIGATMRFTSFCGGNLVDLLLPACRNHILK